MKKIFKITALKILNFTLFAQLLAILITKQFYVSPLVEQTYEPFGRTVEGAVANSLPLLAAIFFFSSFLVFLIKLKKFNVIKAIVVSFLIGSTFSINLILFSSIFPDSSLLPSIFSILFVALIFFVCYVKSFSFLSKFLSLLIASEAAAYFATILRPPTVFVFPILLALYDIYTVFGGPLKKIIGKPKRTKAGLKVKLDFLPLLVVDFNFIKIGLGDVVFYSMLPAVGFMVYGIKKMLLTLLATNIGILITLYILKKKKIPLPGLPIPMLLGILSLAF